MGGALSKLGASALILLMIFCAMMLWLGIPLIWLYIGSQLVDTTQPQMGPYMVVAVGIILSVILDGMILGRLNRRYKRITDSEGTVKMQLPWLRSMRGEREPARETGVLDVILVATIALAGVVMAIWFFFFAHPAAPGA